VDRRAGLPFQAPPLRVQRPKPLLGVQPPHPLLRRFQASFGFDLIRDESVPEPWVVAVQIDCGVREVSVISVPLGRRARLPFEERLLTEAQHLFPTRSLWRGVLPGHHDRNTIRGNQALDSPHPPASVSPGFVSPALQQSAQGFLCFGRRALGHCTTAVQKSVTFLACHAHLAGIGSLLGLLSRRPPAAHRLTAASKHRCTTD
jgi:hypothetical protein